MEVAQKYHLSREQLETESKLVEAAKADLDKFRPLYDKYYEPVFRYLYQRLDNKETAFDLTSQSFLKAMQHLNSYQSKGVPFSAWLFRIAQNEMNVYFRQGKAHRTVNIETKGMVIMIDEIVENKLDTYHEELINEISKLPESELQLIEMRYFEKRHFKEIGDILGITENNAKVRLYRTLDKLKKLILKR